MSSSNFWATLSGYVNYKGGQGLASFLLHRITGLGTLLFLSMHILTTSAIYFAPQWYDKLIAIFRWPPIMLAEIILVFCVIYHGANGLRIAYFDLIQPALWKKQPAVITMKATLVIAIILWIPPAAVMGYNLLRYGFGLFGGG